MTCDNVKKHYQIKACRTQDGGENYKEKNFCLIYNILFFCIFCTLISK